ncbi:MAG: hypothetical protein WB988_19005 [Candidatus Nitrosopolaris sp.]
MDKASLSKTKIVVKRFSVYLKDNSTFDPDKRLDEIGEVAKKFFTKGQIT